ncbi:ATP-binding protein [Algoriphagus antarcticus]|uniref:Uncharacterized protein n=1 Tax=Algoriphagus antarcticus TaxID=238540 RepID=A0A3E0E041_9BACT|nr:HAMP domain-containing histidine kinase [Algoriphagus antarcticus]REG91083.1 hypothetical protein C8N25_105196 [Algoriphagus antarcticus]
MLTFCKLLRPFPFAANGPDSIKGQIFCLFFDAISIASGTSGKGTGLRLSLYYAIVKALGGELIVDSLPEKGLIFTISIPIN